jgi:AcrR family transcriptional regulator
MAVRRAITPRAVSGGRVRSGRVPVARPTPHGRASAGEGPDSTRQRILTSAERLFAELGFDGATMPMIARASEITAGAIYKHFDSKADLFFDVVRRAVQTTSVSAAVEGPFEPMSLPGIVASYTAPRLRLLRRLAVEVHHASVEHADVRRLLRRSLDSQIQQIGDHLSAGQQAGKLDPAVDAELLACAVLVFTMGLMHMETLAPQLVRDPRWRDFVRNRVATLLGVLASDSGCSSE